MNYFSVGRYLEDFEEIYNFWPRVEILIDENNFFRKAGATKTTFVRNLHNSWYSYLLPHVIQPNNSLGKKCNKHGEYDVVLFMFLYVVIDINQKRGITE
jgi:hypothetical protein